MGVAAEVGEHVFGAGERRFAVDDPRPVAQRGEPLGEGDRRRQGGERAGEVQFAPSMGELQAGEKGAAEDLRQGTHGEQEAGRSRKPGGAVRRERSAGHNAVDVEALRVGLAPRMDDGGDAEGSAEVPGIAAEAEQRRAGRVK
jgi:hypothetical protein